METLEVFVLLFYKNERLKEIEDMLDRIIKHEDLVKGVKENLLDFLHVIINQFGREMLNYTIYNISSRKVSRIIKRVERSNIDEFEKRIVLTLLYFDYWRVKYYEEEGLVKYIERSIENFRSFYDYLEVILWYLLYKKYRDRVVEYKDYIESLIEKLNDAMEGFIPEEESKDLNLTDISEEECINIRDLKL